MARGGLLGSLLDAIRGRRDGAGGPVAGPDAPYRVPGHRGPAPSDAVDARRLPLPLAERPRDPRTPEQESAWVAPI
ncbi:MAG TPA: hypothetical protein VLT33_19610, partial [Labilithrix sp.]|nr:hypothetical protein [Labilithrix sp.]